MCIFLLQFCTESTRASCGEHNKNLLTAGYHENTYTMIANSHA